MLNQVVLVGRIVNDIETKKSENGTSYTNMTLAVPRSYKNAEGVYETDFVKCTLWNGVAEKTSEYCRKGDMVGVKGRIEVNSYEKDGEQKYSTNVIADRVTFLSSNKEKDEEVEKEEVTKENSTKKTKTTKKDKEKEM